jgi:hypothetical protein
MVPFTAGCSGGVDVTATYKGDTYEPTTGVAIDSTSPAGATKQMAIVLSTGPISCSYTMEDKEDLPEGKHVLIGLFTQDAGQAQQALITVAVTDPEGHEKSATFGAGNIKVDISSVEDGRVVGELSGSTEIKDAIGMLRGTASAEGSFDVERCF